MYIFAYNCVYCQKFVFLSFIPGLINQADQLPIWNKNEFDLNSYSITKCKTTWNACSLQLQLSKGYNLFKHPKNTVLKQDFV